MKGVALDGLVKRMRRVGPAAAIAAALVAGPALAQSVTVTTDKPDVEVEKKTKVTTEAPAATVETRKTTTETRDVPAVTEEKRTTVTEPSSTTTTTHSR